MAVMPNTKSRHEEIMNACHQATDNKRVDVTEAVNVLPLAKLIAEQLEKNEKGNF